MAANIALGSFLILLFSSFILINFIPALFVLLVLYGINSRGRKAPLRALLIAVGIAGIAGYLLMPKKFSANGSTLPLSSDTYKCTGVPMQGIGSGYCMFGKKIY
ncbi:MAG: hypothetical protein ACM3KM_00280 [Acidobacteriaceae bacterium]